jgi:flotillin
VLRLLYEQIRNGGDQGFAVFMAEKLPGLLSTAADAVKGIDIDRLVVVDGGDGNGVANVAGQRVQASLRMIEQLGGALGIDVESALRGVAERAAAPPAPIAEPAAPPRAPGIEAVEQPRRP